MTDDTAVKSGVYANPAGHVCKVIGVAYYPAQNKNMIVYWSDYDQPEVSRLIVQDVGDFMAALERAKWVYHGVKLKKPKARTLASGFKPGSRIDKKA